MKLFVIQYLYGYLIIILSSHVHSTFIKKALFGWGPAPPYPGYPYPGYPPPPPPPPPPGFGGLLGSIIGKFLSVKYGPPAPPYPYPGYPPAFPPPYPGPFPFPAALPVPVNVPVPIPVDRPYPVPYGKPSLLPPITIVKHISESSKKSDENKHGSSSSHPLFSSLFQMRPPEKWASSWSPMHDNHNSYGNHKEEW